MEITSTVTKSFNAQIWCGLRAGYTDYYHTIAEANKIISEYVNDKRWCVTVTPTHYHYVDGSEPGFVVGIIQYPRFEYIENEIIDRMTELATKLMIQLQQNRVTITTPTHSIMLSNDG